MDLTITLHRGELIQAFRDFIPMRLLLGSLDKPDDLAWIQIDAIDTVTFVPRRGLCMTCAALIHYPIPLVPDDFTVEHVSLAIVPTVVEGPDGPLLAFVLDVDDLDIKYLPQFVERSVGKRINEALSKYATTIAWNFSKTFGSIVDLPKRLELVRSFEFGAPVGRVDVTDDSIIIALSLGVSFHHAPEVAVDDLAAADGSDNTQDPSPPVPTE